MPPRQRAHVNPRLLAWGREQTNLTIEAAARRLHVSTERLQSWEAGTDKPTVRQARSAAKLYRLSLAVFFLPEAPWQYQPIRDYRRLYGTAQAALSPELAIELRLATDRRDVALELMAELDEVPTQFTFTASLQEPTEIVGVRLREYLSVELESQRRWRDLSTAFREWRLALERAGTLVFQARGIDLDEMRGFSIGGAVLPVVVVNRADAYAARTFTLLHELIHLALHSGGLCNLAESGSQQREVRQVETFCNRVAGATLVPSAALAGHPRVTEHARGRWEPRELEPLAREFKVSRQVIIRRLLTLGRTDQTNYDAVMRALEREFQNLPPRAGGFLAPPDNALSLAGRLYTRLALSAYHENRIGPATLSDYLGVRLKHLEALERSAI